MKPFGKENSMKDLEGNAIGIWRNADCPFQGNRKEERGSGQWLPINLQESFYEDYNPRKKHQNGVIPEKDKLHQENADPVQFLNSLQILFNQNNLLSSLFIPTKIPHSLLVADVAFVTLFPLVSMVSVSNLPQMELPYWSIKEKSLSQLCSEKMEW